MMKDGFFTNTLGEKVVQPMVFASGPYKGLAKGLKQVCLERFGQESVQGKKQDALGKHFTFLIYSIL